MSGTRSKSARLIAFERREELGAAEHALDLVAALGVVERLDARDRRVAGHLLDPEVAVGDGRDLRQMRDRHDLGALGETLERVGDGVRRRAADAGVDLVEDHRLAAADGRDRERHARELAARRRLRDRPEREAGVRADQEDRLVGAGRAGSRSRSSTRNSPSPRPTPTQLLRHRVGERRRRGSPARRAQLAVQPRDLRLRRGERLGGRRTGSWPSSSAASSARAASARASSSSNDGAP